MWFSAKGRLLILLAGMALFMGCQSIHIQAGPSSREESEQKSAERGKGLRSEFADRLSNAAPLEKAHILRTFIDSVTAGHFRYGSRIAQQWHQSNVQAGHEVPDSEIRQMVENSLSAEQPILESYDDIVDYGIEEVYPYAVF
ncbi:MAG: hypothetical protein DRP45_10280 [Candidatus Zixiibacteriota bacterium]|nr:MAG: hypothetical protein DRP45_10280 [candidate division Zixibacteria bacterium]